MKTINLFLVLLTAGFCFGQQIRVGKITTVKTDGLHQIILPTIIRSNSNDDLSDLRILDHKKNEVPYFIHESNESILNSNYKEYKIITQSEIPKKQSTLIFENPEKTINEVTLSIANYEGEKSYTLSGSNDLKQWFGIANKNYLTDLTASDATTVLKTIAFPLNNYKFIKIELDDRKSLPIRIITVGHFNSKATETSFLPIAYNRKTITELKSEKKTVIHFEFDYAINIEQIKFQISNPKLYKRYVRIYKDETRKIKNKLEHFQNFLSNFDLRSDSKNSFAISGIKEKDFFIEIDNQDNQPLTIDDVQFFQRPITIIADLKATENYTIKTGNKDLTKPIYDIENFKNSISSNLPITTIYEVQVVQKSVENIAPKAIWQQPWFMWLCITIGGLSIVYFTRNLMRDMNTNNN
jgi:hypothetical protein